MRAFSSFQISDSAMPTYVGSIFIVDLQRSSCLRSSGFTKPFRVLAASKRPHRAQGSLALVHSAPRRPQMVSIEYI